MRLFTTLTLAGCTALATCTQTPFSATNGHGTAFDMRRMSGTSERQYAALTRNSPGLRAVYVAALDHGLDPAFALSIARVESGGNCKAVSPKGAMGVMQLMPGTAKKHGVTKRQLATCEGSAKAGVKEMIYLLQKYGSKKKALISYNCGEGCLKRKRLPKETQRYLRKLNK